MRQSAGRGRTGVATCTVIHVSCDVLTPRCSARNVIAAALKRLAHRNPNVQLYTLTLVEALSKNCGIEVHREIASRAFTQALEKLVTDRVTSIVHIVPRSSIR